MHYIYTQVNKQLFYKRINTDLYHIRYWPKLINLIATVNCIFLSVLFEN